MNMRCSSVHVHAARHFGLSIIDRRRAAVTIQSRDPFVALACSNCLEKRTPLLALPRLASSCLVGLGLARLASGVLSSCRHLIIHPAPPSSTTKPEAASSHSLFRFPSGCHAL